MNRQERKAAARAAGVPFTPQAPPAVDDPRLAAMKDESIKLDQLIESMNALSTDGPKWFLLGPYAFHAEGSIYFHNSSGDMEKWAICTEAEADAARAYLRTRMRPARVDSSEPEVPDVK